MLATASSVNQSFLPELGADVAIDYANEDAPEIALAETGGRGVDAVFDASAAILPASAFRLCVSSADSE